MTVLQIIEEILALAPEGIQLTSALLAFIEALATTFGGASPLVSPDTQKEMVKTLAKYVVAKK